jgi:hypothetical protein
MRGLLLAPEFLWLCAYLVSLRIAAGNTAPDFRWNSTLFPLSILLPVLMIAAVFVLHFGPQPESASWGMLFRCALAGLVGAMAVSIKLVSATGGSGASGAPMALFVSVPLILVALGVATVAAAIRLIRLGQAASFAGAAWKLSAFAALLIGLFLAAQWLCDRRLTASSGEAKAAALSRAYGYSIGASSPEDWQAGAKRWGKYFSLEFVSPNSIRIGIETNYAADAQIADPPRTLEAWRGWIGQALLQHVAARRVWEPQWKNGTLVWSTVIDMTGLSREQFLRDTAEARRFSTGSFGEHAPEPMWWLYRQPMEAALREPSRERQGKRWMAESLRQARDYYQRVAVSGEDAARRRDAACSHMERLADQAMQLPPDELRRQVEQFAGTQRPEQITGVQDVFLVKGAILHLRFALRLLGDADRWDDAAGEREK